MVINFIPTCRGPGLWRGVTSLWSSVVQGRPGGGRDVSVPSFGVKFLESLLLSSSFPLSVLLFWYLDSYNGHK